MLLSPTDFKIIRQLEIEQTEERRNQGTMIVDPSIGLEQLRQDAARAQSHLSVRNPGIKP